MAAHDFKHFEMLFQVGLRDVNRGQAEIDLDSSLEYVLEQVTFVMIQY